MASHWFHTSGQGNRALRAASSVISRMCGRVILASVDEEVAHPIVDMVIDYRTAEARSGDGVDLDQ